MSTAIKENKMGYMPENKLLLSMSVPMMLSMLIQALYNIIDGLFVSGISPEQYELTAVNLAFPAQNLMIAVSVGAGVGINALISRNLGIGNREKANKIAGQGLFLAIVSYLLFATVGVILARPYFELMTSDEAGRAEIIAMGTKYLRICFIFSFGLFAQVVHEKYMQSTGKTMLSMTIQTVGAIINIILDPILIYGWFGLPALGIAGAAYATVIGQISSAIVGIVLQKYKNKEIVLQRSNVKPDKKTISEILKIGFPSILMNSLGSFMTASFNKIIMGLSVYAVNVFGIYFKLQSFVFMPVFGMNNALVPIVAYNYGARKPERCKKAFKILLTTCIVYSCIFWLAIMMFPSFFASVFTEKVELIEFTTWSVKIYMFMIFLFGIQIACQQTFISLGNAPISLFLALLRKVILLIPLIYIVPLFTENKCLGVFLAEPIADFIAVTTTLILFITTFNKTMKKIETNENL